MEEPLKIQRVCVVGLSWLGKDIDEDDLRLALLEENKRKKRKDEQRR